MDRSRHEDWGGCGHWLYGSGLHMCVHSEVSEGMIDVQIRYRRYNVSTYNNNILRNIALPSCFGEQAPRACPSVLLT